MKILHIIDSLAAGGAQKLIDESIPIISEYEGIDVNVLVLTDKNKVFGNNLKKKGINMDVVPFRNVRSLRNIIYIWRYIIRGGYDIVHSHLFPCNYWTSIASMLILKNKPKLVTTEHSTYNKRRNKLYFMLIEKFIYSNYDIIISISESTQQNLMNWLKAKDKTRFIVINNGINLKEFKNILPYKKAELDSKFNEDTKILCMVGSFSKQKDQATIIKAMKYLPEDIFLLLVGDGPLIKEHIDLVRELGIDDRVKFLGIRKDVPRLFKTSDIVIVSSHWEGFGLAAVEGMAAGKPVIASDVPGLAEVVKGAGLLFKKGDSRELANIINDLFNNKKKYEKVKEKCFERAKKYDIKIMVEEYIKVYKSLF